MKSLIIIATIFYLYLANAMFSQNIKYGDDDILWRKTLQSQKVNSAVFHPTSGNIIAAINHQIYEIDPKNGNTIRIFTGQLPGEETDEYLNIVVTEDGKYVVTGSGNNLKGVNVWDYAQGKHLYTFNMLGYVDLYDNVDLLPDGKNVMFLENSEPASSKSNTFTIYKLDIEKKEATKFLSILTTSCDKIKVSKNGNYVVVAVKNYISATKWNHSILRYDVSDVKSMKNFGLIHDAERVEDIQITNDGKYFGIKADNNFFICDEDGKRLVINDLQMLYSFTFSEDSKYLVISYLNQSFQFSTDILDLATLKPFYRYTIKPTLVRLNQQNELFTDEMSYYTNAWYAVDVKENNEDDLKIYTKDDEIKIFSNESIGISHLILSDILGREYRYEIIGNTIKTGLPSGLYLIKIVLTNGQTITKKILFK